MTDLKNETKKGLFSRFSSKKLDKQQSYDDMDFVLSSPTAARKDSADSPGGMYFFCVSVFGGFLFFSVLNCSLKLDMPLRRASTSSKKDSGSWCLFFGWLHFFFFFSFFFLDVLPSSSVSPVQAWSPAIEDDSEPPPPPAPLHEESDFDGLDSSSGSVVRPLSPVAAVFASPPLAEVSNPPPVPKGPPKPPRESIAREILSTEKTYVESLSVLKAVFEAPLKVLNILFVSFKKKKKKKKSLECF
jgi:hypothetical protein